MLKTGGTARDHIEEKLDNIIALSQQILHFIYIYIMLQYVLKFLVNKKSTSGRTIEYDSRIVRDQSLVIRLLWIIYGSFVIEVLQ